MIAAGLLVSLWLWAAQNATDGDLSGCSDRAIAKAAGYRKAPGLFVAALKEAGFLNEDNKLHDWEEYATLLINVVDNQKEQTRERVRKFRERKKGKEARNCNVTERYENESETLCNAPTVPNHTIHNITLPTTLSSDTSTGTSPSAPPAASRGECDITQIVDLYNRECPSLPRVRLLSETTRFLIRERWKQYPDMQTFLGLFRAAEESGFLTGKTGSWRADLDWLMQEKNFSRVINGTFANTPGRRPAVPKGASVQLGEAELEAIRQVMAAPDFEEAAR